MYDVVIFFLKLVLFVGAAVSAVVYMPTPERSIAHNMQVASAQVMLCSLVWSLYMMCARIVSAIRKRQQYDCIDDGTADLDFDKMASADSLMTDGFDGAEGPDTSVAGPESDQEKPGGTADDRVVLFATMGALAEHIMLVHLTGFLVWNTVIALDYTQPSLAFLFTAGLVAALLLEALVTGCCARISVLSRQSLHAFVFLMCAIMLGAVNLSAQRVTLHNASCVVTGFCWPIFFNRHAAAMCRRPNMILHSVRAAHVTCVLLSVCPIVAWHSIGPYVERPSHTLLAAFVVQPAVKTMCVLIMCISLQTGHRTDLALVLTLASSAQFLVLYPLDHEYQIIVGLVALVVLAAHVFGLCHKRAARHAPLPSEEDPRI